MGAVWISLLQTQTRASINSLTDLLKLLGDLTGLMMHKKSLRKDHEN